MILDQVTLLSGAVSATSGAFVGQAVAGTNTSVLSTNTMDLAPLSLGGNQVGDTGAGEGLDFVFNVLAAPTGGTSVQFQLIQADDAALTSNVQVLVQTDAVPIASLPAGTLVPLHLDRAAPYAPKRYLGARYVLVGAIASMQVTCAIANKAADLRTIFKGGYGIA
jgi:hypothetical protein